ncbi:MAG: DUF5110 domain-containing protein [Mediterranea massiliensis]|nr:DUF5110 domain-containing protein [Mediterranea massiliensis]
MKKLIKRISCLCMFLLAGLSVVVAQEKNVYSIPFDEGTLVVTPLQANAVRIQYVEGEMQELPEWIYVASDNADIKCKRKDTKEGTVLKLKQMSVNVNRQTRQVVVTDARGDVVLTAKAHELKAATVQQEPTRDATLVLQSPQDEYLYGLGQFQDGYLNVRGLTRRLTQVNTQIAIPFLLSNKGYGLLWNNYGLTNFNPTSEKVELQRAGATGQQVTVNVTSTEGGRRETRQNNAFVGELNIPADGQYTLLLDVGQKMARRHNLSIDGKTVIDLSNGWLPPTTSILIDLKAGKHQLTAELERGDHPTIYYNKVEDETVFNSPVAECVDYTVFVGNADEVIAAYRNVTGEAPMLPDWALGYIHCRERYHSQADLLENARRFREEQIPLDLIVQDWQYWGKYGWNAMRFDEEHYPDPAKMVSELHDMNLRLMLSVWSKIDPNAELGKEAAAKNYYIPGTSWIDFFDEDASKFYWENFSKRLLKPYQIDAWWQDATEPENDDLEGRRIMKGTQPGERFRNVYPLKVNQTVYEGLRKDDAGRRAMIFTRSGFPGIQRYGSVLWSGDVGNDWQTFRYQISSGLNFVATGLPWWTYDAGGFFRPGDQYTNADYIERMIRWIQTSTFLPLMRVHGYMSNTEPWRYGKDAQRIITDYIKLRYRLFPYIYSEAARVSLDGYTFMRPLVFDFPTDKQALEQLTEYMFGASLLINPVTEKGVNVWKTYLPEHEAGWYDLWTGHKYNGGQTVDVPVNIEKIPVFVKAGTILPMGQDKQSVAEKVKNEPINLTIYPGADATFTLYEDEGNNYNYEQGAYSQITFRWNDKKRQLTVEGRQGSFEGMEQERIFVASMGSKEITMNYTGKKMSVSF